MAFIKNISVMDMDVCILSPSENIWGGGQIYIEVLCKYLNDHGVKAKIATPEPDSFSCDTVSIPSVASRFSRLIVAIKFAKELKRRKCSVVVLNDLSSLWLAPFFKIQGLKVVSLLHLYLEKKSKSGLGHSTIEYRILQASSFFCDKIFSVNKENIKSFPVNVEFVGNFVSGWFFDNRHETDKKYDLALIARLSPQKNIPLFVELVDRLNNRSDQPLRALIVGRGELKEMVRNEIVQRNLTEVIDILPWVERADLPEIYDQAKCFAITSHHEGFATTLLEAHARGLPAITTKSAGYCAEFVSGFDQDSGLSFIPEDVDSDAFIDSVLCLIQSHEDYDEVCVRKARHFAEDRVLGKISSGITKLIPKSLKSSL